MRRNDVRVLRPPYRRLLYPPNRRRLNRRTRPYPRRLNLRIFVVYENSLSKID